MQETLENLRESLKHRSLKVDALQALKARAKAADLRAQEEQARVTMTLTVHFEALERTVERAASARQHDAARLADAQAQLSKLAVEKERLLATQDGQLARLMAEHDREVRIYIYIYIYIYICVSIYIYIYIYIYVYVYIRD